MLVWEPDNLKALRDIADISNDRTDYGDWALAWRLEQQRYLAEMIINR